MLVLIRRMVCSSLISILEIECVGSWCPPVRLEGCGDFNAVGVSVRLTPKFLNLELIGHIQLEFVPVIVVLEFATGLLDCSSFGRDSSRTLLPTGKSETFVAGVVVADDRVVVGIQHQ